MKQDALQHLRAFLAAVETPEEMSPEVIAAVLEITPVLTDWLEAVKTITKARVAAKELTVPGWELGPGRRGREWLSESDAVSAMSAAGINDPYKSTLLSVSEAEKKLPEAAHEALKAAWTWRPGTPSLRRSNSSASRPTTESVFGPEASPPEVPAPTPSSQYGW